MLTQCPRVVRMPVAILSQSLHQNIGVELLHVVHSNAEALSMQHRITVMCITSNTPKSLTHIWYHISLNITYHHIS